MKRKHDADDIEIRSKRARIDPAVKPIDAKTDDSKRSVVKVAEPKTKFRKLAPTRPFPTVPTSVSGSGPKSAHKEGRNFICVTRKTTLSTYLGRCKKLFMEEGYDVLHLHGMGAAIPHLLMLAVSLPEILPFAKDEIQTEIRTGSVEVIDEIIPNDEDQDIGMRRREKGSVSVILKLTKPRRMPPGRIPQMIYASKVDTTSKRSIIIAEEDLEDLEDIGQEINESI